MMIKALSLLIAIVAACTYDASYTDCTIRCTDAVGCPDDLVCHADGFCRPSGEMTACAPVEATAPSCDGLPKTCGPTGDEDCCSTATTIPGGSFYRSYDTASDGMYSAMSYPATVSAFKLDRFEVTVGRFRKFVEAGMGTMEHPPSPGTGAHEKINASGWDSSWNASLAASTPELEAGLQCDALYQTWTSTSTDKEDLPINCVTWFEANAFCGWDGGMLPSEAEWNFAAAGGNEQRAYPWSTPADSIAVDCAHANYNIDGGPTYCEPGTGGAVAAVNRVGSESPRGDGKWLQADLGGNSWEWVLDKYAPFTSACEDCANLATGDHRVIRGGNFSHSQEFMRTANRGLPSEDNSLPASRTRDVGFRCARKVP